MLTSLSLRNFKCFESVDMPLGRITVLIGPNGTGKSSLLHALALLRQSVGESQLVYSGPLVDASDFQDVVFLKNPLKSLEIRYSCTSRVNDSDLVYSYSVMSGTSLQ